MLPASRKRAPSKVQALTESIENDPQHHFSGSFLPQTPLGEQSSGRSSPVLFQRGQSPWYLRWAVDPVLALKFIVVPVALYYVLEFVKSILKLDIVNPFGALVFLSHPVADSPPGDPRYQKGWSDIPFVLYYIFWIALFRSIITTTSKRIAMYFGLKSETKLDRFGEQGYAMVYGSLAGLWGIRIMSTLPTWWFKTEYYWIDYPHWDMKSELKRYYLIQSARWLHELLIMILGVEKPRKDFFELILHHIVTLWLIFWSYLVNLTLIGNGIFVTMDISEVFLDFSMILNYLQMKRSKLVAFFVFFGVWTYLRHYVNIKILYSVWVHFGLIPESARQWLPSEGAWMVWWMKYQIWTPIFALQLINLFWYYLMWRILIRGITTAQVTDVRSDDEDEEEDKDEESNKKDD